MKGIRVLRILEYVYESPERAETDMARWTHSITDGKGVKGMEMRSAVLPFETIEWEKENDE